MFNHDLDYSTNDQLKAREISRLCTPTNTSSALTAAAAAHVCKPTLECGLYYINSMHPFAVLEDTLKEEEEEEIYSSKYNA